MPDGSPMAEAFATKAQDTRSEKRAAKRSMRKFKVDLWATDFNTAEIGILKRTQNEAASDQFTKDMEIIGQTVDQGEREAIIAYRQELWDETEGTERRLVLKLFSETLGWRGTMEMMVGRSLQLTRGAGIPVTAFSLNMARHEQLIQVERCARKWPLLPERFTFFIETKRGPRFYTLRENLFTLGADYSLFDEQNRKIGHLDQQIFNLGGAWIVKLDKAHTHRKLETVLEMFCAMLKFNRASKRHIKCLHNNIRDGKISPELSHREVDLYYNPRRRR